jgi:hypothetical protein
MSISNLNTRNRYLKTRRKRVRLLANPLDEHLYKRYLHRMETEKIPAEPTREQELAYLKWLENSFKTDKIVTLHPKHYGASPWRLQFKNFQEMRSEYKKTFIKNFFLVNILSWPVLLL